MLDKATEMQQLYTKNMFKYKKNLHKFYKDDECTIEMEKDSPSVIPPREGLLISWDPTKVIKVQILVGILVTNLGQGY